MFSCIIRSHICLKVSGMVLQKFGQGENHNFFYLEYVVTMEYRWDDEEKNS